MEQDTKHRLFLCSYEDMRGIRYSVTIAASSEAAATIKGEMYRGFRVDGELIATCDAGAVHA